MVVLISLSVGFCDDDLDYDVVSIRCRGHIKFPFICMLHQTRNLRYYRHIRIITCVGLEPFLLAINLDVVSSSNVLSSLIYVFKFKSITVLNQRNFIFHCQTKKKRRRASFEIFIYIYIYIYMS